MWKEFRIAVSFLTRLPLPYKGEWDEKSFSRSSVFFPLVGLIIGALVCFVIWLVRWTEMAALCSVLAIITAIVISGGIHMDGFMDMCDGLFASRGRERALEIMKDSRVGSFAVLGVILLLLLKFVLYGAIIPEIWWLPAILGAFVFSRFTMICCILCFPSARSEGLGVTVKKYVSKPALLWGLVLTALVFCIHGFYPLLIAFVLSWLAVMGIAAQINKFLHGLTGDIYGAMAELGDALFMLLLLIVCAVLSHFGITLFLF